ncbi:methyl-accepting chemotaxis protein [Lysinibacillus piscis]|uniref:Methyl-accepting chemotaxis protein n=1 Tax=Lysinibacillus piscis TaxID=2518931 RepID=A0ABQ5NFE0_9BACI|nr:methyl-accepting chemotaxis protein [Lysinibacillus sp. KH24]GLC87099.1 hypothetical protein LYSBPC_02260 [Lysinibacillus sp. KH24]
MKLKGKLLLSFFIIIGIFLSLSLYALYGLYTNQSKTVAIYEDGLVPTTDLVKLSQLTENTRVNMLSAILNESTEPTTKALQNLDDINTIIERYASYNMKSNVQQQFEIFKEKWGLFEKRVRLNTELIQKNDYVAAYEGVKIGGPLFQEATKAQMELATLNEAMANDLIKENRKSYTTNVNLFIIGGIIDIIITILIAIFFSRYLSKHIQIVVDDLNLVAQGDLSNKTITIKTKDEIAMLVRGLTDMKTSLTKLVHSTTDASQQVAASSEQLTASSQQSALVVQQMAQVALQTAEGAEQQFDQMTQITTFIEQMNDSANQIATNSHQMLKLSKQSEERAAIGEKSVNTVTKQMEEIVQTNNDTAASVQKLAEQSKKIEEIIQMITSIADQTNLLALNAAIEAARAGEHGKGFAVVADEVRKLAEQSSQSGQQIVQTVQEIQDEVERAVAYIDEGTTKVNTGLKTAYELGTSFHEISQSITSEGDKITQVTDAIEAMQQLSTQITMALSSINQITAETVEATQETSAASEQQAAMMEEIASTSDTLANLAEQLQQSIETFKIS